MSLRTRLVLLVILALLPVFALQTWSSLRMREESLARARLNLLTLTRQAAASEERLVEGARQLLNAITSTRSIKSGDRAQCTRYFQELVTKHGTYTNLGVVALDGNMYCHALEGTPYVGDRPFVQQTLRANAYWVGEYILGRASGRAIITFAMPLLDAEGRRSGVAFASMDVTKLMAQRRDIGLPPGVWMAVTDRNGTILASHGDARGWIGEKYADPALYAAIANPPAQTVQSRGADGIDRLYAFAAAQGGERPGLHVITSVSLSDILAPFGRKFGLELLLLSVVALASILAARWIGEKTIVRPTRRLLAMIDELGGEDRTTPARQPAARDELARLTGAFTRVSVILRKRESERDLTEAMLRQAQDRLLTAQRIGGLGNWELEVGTGKMRWSDEIYRILGLDRDVFPSTYQGFLARVHPDDRARLEAAVASAVAGRTTLDIEHRVITGESVVLWVHELGESQADAGGQRLYGTVQDITQRKHSQGQLALLGAAVACLNDIVIITEAEPIDLPGPRIVFVNDAFERRTGYRREEVIGKSPRILQGPATQRGELDRIRAAMAQWRPVRAELINYTREGKEYWIEVDIVPIMDPSGSHTHFVSVERDITERRELEARLRQSQRLESVGQLTGGVAHDFNNLLTVILGNADVLVEELQSNPRLEPLARMIGEAAQRGADLTRHLLAFARKQALDPKAVDVGQLVGGMESILRRTLGEHIEIQFPRVEGLWPALVDPAQLESAVLNLCLNARDAMPLQGRLAVETANKTLDADAIGNHPDVVAGDYVMVAVSDTGTGIAPEDLARVFEPFFTTKEQGKGTGLGLAMVYGFARQSGGHVTIYSEIGHGTTVKIYLPRAAPGPTAATGASEHGNLEGGSEIILLVEDDELVRQSARGHLTALGYVVIEAQDGYRALAALEAGRPVDLMFTDVVMPVMSGRQLAERALEIRPGLKVLYTSGYAEDAIVHHGRLDAGVQFLGKPYRRAELARRVRAALDAEPQ